MYPGDSNNCSAFEQLGPGVCFCKWDIVDGGRSTQTTLNKPSPCVTGVVSMTS